MSYCLRLLLVLLLFVKQEAELAIALRKFVYQKDMSEYCRRRVMPSVFLGRQVTDAYSQILHFSRLELPYSCFVSIRTESGSNIILVIQLLSDKSLIESCRESKNQLLVYELGETFGGYWGALPENVMKRDPPSDENRYTLKTTQPTTTTTTKERTTQRRTWASATKSMESARKKSSDQQDDIIMEFPIVNVSAKLVPGHLPVDTLFDTEESFDIMFDVKPWPDVGYKTKILPLVQFSIADEVSARRTTEVLGVPQYEVDFNADLYTPDFRIKFPLLQLSTKSKQFGKYKYNVNTRLDFNKNKKLLHEKEDLHYRQPSPQKDTKHNSKSWDVVDAILKNLSKTKDDVPNMKMDEDLANLLQGLAKIGRNESMFLVPNSSWYTRSAASTRRPILTKYRTDSITWRQPSASYRTNYLEDIEDTTEMEGMTHDDYRSSNTSIAESINDPGALLPPVLDVNKVIVNVAEQKNTAHNTIKYPEILASEVSGTSTSTTPETVKPLTLVDHESWENMVHAASLMAVMLNQSVTSSADGVPQGQNVTLSKLSNVASRKKRYIHAIPIDHVKPHHLPVKVEVPSSTEHTDRISDAQEFQRLIEVHDDEVHDRVALRYLRQYVGPALFNICDFEEAAARHVYLFNSSRLLERMTVVMTPARTLLTSDARCAAANLECQVSGARVCIDSLSACDGVPNCGSYDIYDEDRLTCGGSAGLQHNVCLAAVTFLAVLLTILYTVHYWLKRCVPKVSDAFFIYTDAAENVLYLDPIMRSPHDTEPPKGFYRGGGIQDYMECTDMRIRRKSVGSYIHRFIRFFRCKRKKRIPRDEIAEAEYDLHPGDSFSELELGKIESTGFVTDVGVQTGSSLEIEVLERVLTNEHLNVIQSEIDDIVAHYEGKNVSTDSGQILDVEMAANQPSDELSILKFFRRARSISRQMSSHNENIDEVAKYQPHTEEKEIQSLEYDRDIMYQKPVADSVISITDEIGDKKPEHGHIRKKLRFEDDAKMIPADEDDAQEEEIVPERHRRSVMFVSGKHIQLDNTESNTDVNEPSTSTANRELKSYFWGKNKLKKSTKKKTQLSLR